MTLPLYVKDGVYPAYAHFMSKKRGLVGVVDWYGEHRYDHAIFDRDGRHLRWHWQRNNQKSRQ